MSTFAHGLCVWPSGALGIRTEGIFTRTLPEDLGQLHAWIHESPRNVLTVIIAKPAWDYKLIADLKALTRTCYIIVWHPDATEDAKARIVAFQNGASMVTNDCSHLHEALRLITSIHGTGKLECPWCGLAGLSRLELWQHQPLYHIYEPDKLDAQCPACHRWTSRLTRHINLHHGPTQLVDERTGVFALAVVRRPTDGKFLLVQERYSEGYWLPGGGVDPGESLRQGVVREVHEEAGADVVVTGILTIESFHRGSWRRIIFLAEAVPVPELPAAAAAGGDPAVTDGAAGRGGGGGGSGGGGRFRCKTLPDVESAGACWATADELAELPLRNAPEPMTWIPWVAGGGRVLPLDPEQCPELTRVFPDIPL